MLVYLRSRVITYMKRENGLQCLTCIWYSYKMSCTCGQYYLINKNRITVGENEMEIEY